VPQSSCPTAALARIANSAPVVGGGKEATKGKPFESSALGKCVSPLPQKALEAIVADG